MLRQVLYVLHLQQQAAPEDWGEQSMEAAAMEAAAVGLALCMETAVTAETPMADLQSAAAAVESAGMAVLAAAALAMEMMRPTELCLVALVQQVHCRQRTAQQEYLARAVQQHPAAQRGLRLVIAE